MDKKYTIIIESDGDIEIKNIVYRKYLRQYNSCILLIENINGTYLDMLLNKVKNNLYYDKRFQYNIIDTLNEYKCVLRNDKINQLISE